jgi:uncharacterized protein YndB with AHSA1/START domain
MTGNTLRMERTYRAPAQAVFDAWTSEEVIRRWWHAEHDWETSEAEVDLRVGGAVRVVMRNPHTGTEYGGGGRYTEIDRPNRVAFTWIRVVFFRDPDGNSWAIQQLSQSLTDRTAGLAAAEGPRGAPDST